MGYYVGGGPSAEWACCAVVYPDGAVRRNAEKVFGVSHTRFEHPPDSTDPYPDIGRPMLLPFERLCPSRFEAKQWYVGRI